MNNSSFDYKFIKILEEIELSFHFSNEYYLLRLEEAISCLQDRGKIKTHPGAHIARKTGLSESYISGILNRRKPLTQKVIKKFEKAFDLWLIDPATYELQTGGDIALDEENPADSGYQRELKKNKYLERFFAKKDEDFKKAKKSSDRLFAEHEKRVAEQTEYRKTMPTEVWKLLEDQGYKGDVFMAEIDHQYKEDKKRSDLLFEDYFKFRAFWKLMFTALNAELSRRIEQDHEKDNPTGNHA